MTILGYYVPAVALLLGALQGLVFGLLGVGLVLVYRSSRFINFAHGDIGTFGASVLGYLAIKEHTPYWLALVVGVIVSAGLAGLTEVVIVRPLAKAPRLMSMVATIGTGQFLQLVALAVLAQGTAQELYPNPPGLPSFRVQNVYISSAYVAMAILAPLAVLGLTVFFRRSRYGLAIRGAAANPDAASMAGMAPKRLTTLSWTIAGALACLTAALLLPNSGGQGATSLGPFLLTRALAAAVIAKMTNLWVTFLAGIGIGVLDYVVHFATNSQGPVDVAIFGVILVALLLQAKPGRREEEKGAWDAVKPWPPLPEAYRKVWAIRNLALILSTIAIGVGCLVPKLLSNGHTLSLTVLVSYALVGLSLSVMTGLSGQLSLGQFAIAAVGSLSGIWALHHTHDALLGLIAAAAGGALISVVIGVPALRVRGLLLAVTSLAFSVAVTSWLLPHNPPWGFGSTVSVGRVSVFGIDLNTAHQRWFLALGLLALALWLTGNLARSGFGRMLVALRDNEDTARAFGVSATSRKLQSYAVAGVLAGLGGGMFTFAQSGLGGDSFGPTVSLLIVIITVVGGVGVIGGPLLGAVVALPFVVNLSPGVSALITFGWLALILQSPGGVVGALRPIRERLIDRIATLSGVDVAAARASADPALAEATDDSAPGLLTSVREPEVPAARTSGEPLLSVRGLRKRYGGLHAVDGVDLDVLPGEVLGLIGPNGAGKTTLFECLSGFVQVDEGSISFEGREVTRWTPERRAHAGLIRSFQDSAMFATMTVLETVLVACEHNHPSRPALAAIGLDRSEVRRETQARELLALLGLDRYRHLQVGALSTGTRRIAELACLVALEPTLLLLDEPSSGVAQREVEALGEVLDGIRRQLRTTLVIIEHDIPLVAKLSDRIVAMETGKVLAIGTPDDVLTNDAVVEAYLGGDVAAVQRSGTVATA